jgi:hypothetical protein
MYLTEEEAREKWCPVYGRGIGTVENEAGRTLGTYNDELNCIASECMMWRWKELEGVVAFSKYGYCGLAGKPW